jgi:hypothetical protein
MGYIQDQEMIRLIECIGHTLRHIDPDFMSLEQVSYITREAEVYLEQNP